MTAVATPPKIRPEDFLSIDSMLSDEERDIRDTVRAFVRDRVVPHVGDWFEHGTIPRELATDLDHRYPGMRFRVIDEQGQIRPHIKFFVNGAQVRSLADPLAEADEVLIVCALSGG